MKLTRELANVYYTAAEAKKTLGLDNDTFQYWGKTKRITRIYLPGRTQPVYSKKEINNMVSKIETTILAEKISGLEYRKATINDIDQEIELASLVFGARAGLPEAVNLRRTYLEKNQDTTYHLYESDHLVAYINLIPFNHNAIEEFKEGRKGWLLGKENIEQFVPGRPLECVIIDMATTPMVSPARRGTYAQLLLENFEKTLTKYGENGIEIVRVYAASNTPSGIRIIKHVGFNTLKEIGAGTGRFTFELDVETVEAKFLRGYKDAIREWKNKKGQVNKNVSKTRKITPLKPNVGVGV